MADPQFVAILEAALAKAGGKQLDLAQALHLSESRLSKVLKGDSGALNILGCLRLADFVGMYPALVLRAAGQGEAADLIEKTYGRLPEPLITVPQLKNWTHPALPTAVESVVRDFLLNLEKISAPKRKKRQKREPR